jgi:hypothetical protein
VQDHYKKFDLTAEEDLARELLASLDESRRARAIIETTAPQDIVTGNSRQVNVQGPVGLPASAMTETQRGLLWQLIAEYVQNMYHDVAHRQLDKIKTAGIDKLHFAWAGSQERGKERYYRVHGPTVLIEYDNT